MGLRDEAEEDLSEILEDDIIGAGWPIKVTSPEKISADLTGYSGDISQLIDPETGQAVSGRIAHVTLRISSLSEKGLALPEGIADASKKPWVVEFNDINGSPFKFKVQESNPDRTLGIVNCILEFYE